jgi:hypothetical protein
MVKGVLHGLLTMFNNITDRNVVECCPRHITLLWLSLNPTATSLVTIGGMPVISVVILLSLLVSSLLESDLRHHCNVCPLAKHLCLKGRN